MSDLTPEQRRFGHTLTDYDGNVSYTFTEPVVARFLAELRESIAANIEARCTDTPTHPVYTTANHAYADAARIARGGEHV